MKAAILLYEDFTALDAVGPYEVLSRMPDTEVVFTAARPGPVRTDMGSLALTADAALEDVADPDLLLIPGGPGVAALLADERVLEWVRGADARAGWTASVCSGSLLLAAAGLLRGRRATSHWVCLELLATFGAAPSAERVVVDGHYATAAGVSAGIDLALTLAGRIAGDRVAEAIQLVIEYDPRPPYAMGSTDRAPAELVAALTAANLVVTGSGPGY